MQKLDVITERLPYGVEATYSLTKGHQLVCPGWVEDLGDLALWMDRQAILLRKQYSIAPSRSPNVTR